MAERRRDDTARVDPEPSAGVAPGESGVDVALQILPVLPAWSSPRIDGYDIAGWHQPADETGGDFVDFQNFGGGRLSITIGDVSGHGIGPSLIVDECRALLYATLLETTEPARVLARVNRLLCGLARLDDRFVTVFFGMLDASAPDPALTYVSAGQGPILLFQQGCLLPQEQLIQGFPLGLGPDRASTRLRA